MYGYYKLTSGEYANSNQQITDSSGLDLHGVNGSSATADADDCTPDSEGLVFNGSCYFTVTGLNLSKYGFSVEMEVKPSVSHAVEMTLLETTGAQFKLKIAVLGNFWAATINGSDSIANTCTLNQNSWSRIAVSIDSDGFNSWVVLFCQGTVLH